MSYESYAFSTYEKYLNYQKKRGSTLQGKKITANKWWYRQKLIDVIKKNFPKAKTLLCLGARDNSEVQDFIEAGFEAEGIDLFQREPNIFCCDMSNLDTSPRYKNKTFDIFIALDALEHCLNIKSFKQHSLTHCNLGFGVVLPFASDPYGWDCTLFSWMKTLSYKIEGKKEIKLPSPTKKEIEKDFSGFKCIWTEEVNRKRKFMLFLQKNKTS